MISTTILVVFFILSYFMHAMGLQVFEQKDRSKVYRSGNCGPSMKATVDGNCHNLQNDDVLKAMHWITKGPGFDKESNNSFSLCDKTLTIQGITICDNNIKQSGTCRIWSIISSVNTNNIGSLTFELYWASMGCLVTIFHFTVLSDLRNQYDKNSSRLLKHPNLVVKTIDIQFDPTAVGDECFACFYKLKEALDVPESIDILKIQALNIASDELDGVQYLILSDLYLHRPEVLKVSKQVSFVASFSSIALHDTIPRVHETAWNIWASYKALSESFISFSSNAVAGPNNLKPVQYEYILDQANLSSQISNYYVTYIKPSKMLKYQLEESINKQRNRINNWSPNPARVIKPSLPEYCQAPSQAHLEKMDTWIQRELLIRCIQNMPREKCDLHRTYQPFIPCIQDLVNALAEDYSISKGWCNFNHKAAYIEPLVNVDQSAKLAFRKPYLNRDHRVRICFFFTVYTDFLFVERLLNRLYSIDHYYLIHVDPAGSKMDFKKEIYKLADRFSNVFVVEEIPIVYGAATASILLTRAMAWFHKFASGWDYFLCVTGSDYPLVPLYRIEKILSHKKPHMPFVMAWTSGTSTHSFRLVKTHSSVFQDNHLIAKSIEAVNSERGRVLGTVPMESRASNFGPPLFCNNRSSYYLLNNRVNRSAAIYDTQWLFPRDKFPGKGRAVTLDLLDKYSPSFDNVWRVWKKSDPATTGAYDRASVEYIVASEEGRKYYHFFKHVLLGSEEHYYVSLLYNWPRTKAFVQSLSAEIVWNTWKIGIPWPVALTGFVTTHTHYLSNAEWELLQGFSLRGMIFARKFNSVLTSKLLDKIDNYILLNSSTDAGLYWPGFYEVDVSSPGKQWVAAYRHNQSIAKAHKAADKKNGIVWEIKSRNL